MALDAFLQFTDPGVAAPKIDGETMDAVMSKLSPKPFDITNWSFGITQSVNIGSGSGGAGAGKVVFDPFKVTKNIDQSSPIFFNTLCTGGHFGACNLQVRKSGVTKDKSGGIFLTFGYKMVFVTDIQWADSDPSPTEDIQFEYGALQITYKEQGTGGALGAEHTTAWSRVYNNNKFDVKPG